MDNGHEKNVREIQNEFLKPIGRYTPYTYLWIGLLSVIALWGVYAYIRQLVFGLEATAMRNYVTWGLYISTFVFFIGISHSGTLVSAILRITNKEWRRPITRSAELLTFVSLLFGGIMPIIDMGRPDRIHHMVLFGRLQSPLMWDILCIGTYFCGSTLFLYLPMIPDIALCRDRLSGNASKFRMWIYRKLSLGWQDTPANWERLELCMKTMTIIIIPIAVSVHTVVGYIFAMTLRPGWNSTIFGPYFVAGALYSGSAAVVLVMAAFRKINHLENYITQKQFNYMGQIVLALTLIYTYFNINEYAVPAYKMQTAEGFLLHDLFEGTYSTIFWTLQFGTVLFPALMLCFPKGRTPTMAVIACSIIVVGAWIKRYVIVIPTLLHPILPIQGVPYEWSHYFPNWVEWSITFGALAGIFLVITLFSKIFPIVSIWEVVEGREVEKNQQLMDEIKSKEKETDGKVGASKAISSLTIGLAILLSSFGLYAAHEKSEANIGLSIFKDSNGKRRAVAIVMAMRKEGKPQFASGVLVSFYANQNSPQQFLGSYCTNSDGKAQINLSDSIPKKDDGSITLVAKIKNDTRYFDVETEASAVDVNLALLISGKDNSRTIWAVVSSIKSNEPIKGAEVVFYVQRLFGPMPFTENATVITDPEGKASITVPNDIKGDEKGNIVLVARIEDDEKFGNVEATVSTGWGIPLIIEKNPFPTTLWEPRAPLWLKVSFTFVFGGIWLTFLFILYQLTKLQKLKNVAAQDVLTQKP